MHVKFVALTILKLLAFNIFCARTDRQTDRQTNKSDENIISAIHSVHLAEIITRENYRVGHKNVALYFCPYLNQLMTNFQIFSLTHSADNLQ